MAAATVTQIKDRVVALWALTSGVVTSVDDYPTDDLPFEDAELPAAVTRFVNVTGAPVQVTRTYLAAGVFHERIPLVTILHVARIQKADVLAPNTTEMELCEPFLRQPAVYFAQRPRLGSYAAGLTDMVYDCELMSNTVIVKIERPNVDYWGIVYTLPVIEEISYEGYDYEDDE